MISKGKCLVQKRKPVVLFYNAFCGMIYIGLSYSYAATLTVKGSFIDKRCFMRVSYNKLWKLLIDKRMSKSELRDAVNMSSNTLAKMGKEETVSMDVIMRICKELKCDVGDIIEILPDEELEVESK